MAAWQDPTKKSFTIPKKKPAQIENVKLTRNVETSSRSFQDEWLPLLQRNCLNQGIARNFHYSKFKSVENSGLAQKFEDKIRAFKAEGNYSHANVTPVLGFLQVYSDKEAEHIARNGLSVGHALDGKLGHPEKGVFLSKYSDVLSGAPLMDGSSGIIVIFKVLKGKVKRVGPNSQTMDPTPGFDCHVTQSHNTHKTLAPLEQLNYARMYLYEYEDCEIVEQPSTVLPIGIVMFRYSESGEFRPRNTADNVSWVGSLRLNPEGHSTVWSCHDCRLSSHYTRVKPFGLTKNLMIKNLVPIQKAMEWHSIQELASSTHQGFLYKKKEQKVSNHQFASCWRLSLASTNQRETSDFVHMIDKMKKSKVAGVSWLRGSTSILIFPAGDLTSLLGIPNFNDIPSLHCLIVSYRSILTGLSYAAAKDPYDMGHECLPALGSTLRPDTRMVFAFRQMHINPAGGGQLSQILGPNPEEEPEVFPASMEEEEAPDDLGPEKMDEEDMILDEDLVEKAKGKGPLLNTPEEKTDTEKGAKKGYGIALAAGSWKPLPKSKDPRIQRRVEMARAKIKAQSKDETGSLATEYSMKPGSIPVQNCDDGTDKSFCTDDDSEAGKKRLHGITEGAKEPPEKKLKLDQQNSKQQTLKDKLAELKTLGGGSKTAERSQQETEASLLDRAAEEGIVILDAPDSPPPSDDLALESAAYSNPPPRISLNAPGEQQFDNFTTFSRAKIVVQEPVVTSTTPTRQKDSKCEDSKDDSGNKQEGDSSSLVLDGTSTHVGEPTPKESPLAEPMPSPDSAGPLGAQVSGIIVPDDNIFNRASEDQVLQLLEALHRWKQMDTASWSVKLHSQVVLQLAQAKKNLNPDSPSSKRLSVILQNLTKFRRLGVVELLQYHSCDSAPRAPKEYLPCIKTLAAVANFAATAGFTNNPGKVILLSNMDSSCAAAEEFKRAGIMVMNLAKFIETFMENPPSPTV